jgi:hypothetical protein
MTLEDCLDYLLADRSCKPLVPVRGDAFRREQSMPFLSYAACFWPQHLRNTTYGENDTTAILTKIQALLISLQCRTWIGGIITINKGTEYLKLQLLLPTSRPRIKMLIAVTSLRSSTSLLTPSLPVSWPK